MTEKHAFFIGRWQPFHKGHRWLIDQKLKKGISCIVAVRDIPPDENNPYTVEETVEMLHNAFEGEPVQVIVIPDIESVNYGRGVGYDIVEHVPPTDIERISATEIRRKIRSGDDSWKEMVDPKIINWLENYYKEDKGRIIWLTGLSGSGKSTLAEKLVDYYKRNHKQVILLDGDVIRNILPTTGFSISERNEHVKRVGYTATLLAENGINVVCSLISPFNESREYIRNLYSDFNLVYVKCSINECIKRDTKGLYKKALAGEIKDFTGVNQSFEEPINPTLIIETDKKSIDESFLELLSIIKSK